MVFYNETAQNDLEQILYGLATWQKHPLEFEHARNYVKALRIECEIIDTKNYHRNTSFQVHKEFGDKLFVYKRNAKTQWNIIYNWQPRQRIAFINKIVNNYLTK
jgi:hypothetical protein